MQKEFWDKCQKKLVGGEMQKQFGGRGRAKVDKWTWSASVRDRLLSKMKMQNIRKKLVFALRFVKIHYKMLQNQQKLQGFCCKEHNRQKHLGMQHNWLSTAQWAVQKQKRLQTLVETFPKNLKLVLTLINLTSTTLPPISKDWWLSWVQSSWIWVRYSPRLLAKGCFCLLQVVMLHPVLLQVLLVWLVSLASFLLLSQCIHYISLAILTQFLPERMELIEQWIILFLFLFFIGGSAAQFFLYWLVSPQTKAHNGILLWTNLSHVLMGAVVESLLFGRTIFGRAYKSRLVSSDSWEFTLLWNAISVWANFGCDQDGQWWQWWSTFQKWTLFHCLILVNMVVVVFLRAGVWLFLGVKSGENGEPPFFCSTWIPVEGWSWWILVETPLLVESDVWWRSTSFSVGGWSSTSFLVGG